MKFSVLTRINRRQTENLEQRIKYLELQMETATSFVKEIEKGNLEVNYEGSNGEGENLHELATSLISLRNQLKTYSAQEKERNWVSEGLAKFIDILRAKNDDMSGLADHILSSLVKYMEASQGALYTVHDHDPKDSHINMVACYAYDRKKYLNKRIEFGEGTVGQIVLEKETIYMTEIPSSYLQITSGLGQATPSNLLIVPLKIDSKVLGVIELASFNPIKPYQIEFVERLGESIASTISSVNVSQHTTKLLQETQFQAEQMRAQEEEMRQNMEELSATQEEIQRVLNGSQEKETYLNNLLNASTDSIITIDQDYKIVMFNSFVKDMLEGQGVKLVKGMDISTLSKPGSKEKDKQNFAKAFNGETVTARDDYSGYFFDTTYQPLRNLQGLITGVLVTSRDITKDVQLQSQTEELLKAEKMRMEEISAQEEELRQNMEELSTTQEEMHRVLKEVQDKERYLNELINVPKDSIFTIDREYKIISANKSLSVALEAMGIADVKGFDMLSFYPEPEEKKKFQSLYDRAFAGENFEYTSDYNFDGNVSYYTTNYAPLRNAEGEIFAIANFVKDTTAMMLAMKEVQEKERYLNELINVPKDSIFTIDKDYKIISANKALSAGLEAMGIKDVTGFDMLSFYPDPEEKKKFRALYDRAFEGENFEHTQDYTFDGITSYYTTNYAPLRDSKGEIFAVANFSRDTTNFMKTMKEVQEKERYLNELINVPKDSIFTIDKDYRIISANKALSAGLENMGIKDVIGFDMLSLYPDAAEKKKFKALYDRAFAGENFEHTIDYTFDGLTSYYTTNYAPLRNAEGEFYAVANFAKDTTAIVSAQRKAEQMAEEIRAQEEELRQNMEELSATQEDMHRLLKASQEKEHYLDELINVSKDTILTIDREYKIISCNKVLADQYAAFGIEGIGKGFDPLSILPEEQKKQQIALYKKVFKGETIEMTQEFLVQGTSSHIHMNLHPLRNDNNEIFGIAIFSRDVTASVNNQKRLEELLKNSGIRTN